MLIHRQPYSDSTFSEAVSLGYDTLQLKYDGWWTRHECIAGLDTVYSETGRELARWPIHHSIYGTFIGEYMYGTEWAQDPSRKGKVFLHDCYSFEGNPLNEVAYANRYNALIINKHLLPKNFELISCVPIAQYPTVWDSCVVHDSYEGVVFRKSFGKLGDTILREKLVVTLDGVIIGFCIGEAGGKYANTLGAVKVLLHNGTVVKVGGGFSDAMRDEIWHNTAKYLDRPCEVKGNRVFSSGSLRHPNFVRFRDDKLPA